MRNITTATTNSKCTSGPIEYIPTTPSSQARMRTTATVYSMTSLPFEDTSSMRQGLARVCAFWNSGRRSRVPRWLMLILLIVVLVLLFGGGGSYYYGRNAGWGAPHYGGSLAGLVVVILLILYLTGNL